MEHYVTLFDSLFLPQGLALHMSMERHAGPYSLWILCVDDRVSDALTRINLPNVKLLQLSNLETEDLKRVKPTRSKGEYCWTLTPFTHRFVFEADPSIGRVTYIDADGWFRKSPEPIFREFGTSGKHVLITDHGYAPEYDLSGKSGQYCVQFMTFTRGGGEVVRRWWEDRCVDWCFARYEDGKFGDQKYLDDWPTRFEEFVHVLQRLEWMQAPWNATRFPFDQCIFYHFQGLRIVEGLQIDLGPTYGLPKVLIKNVYKPYIADLVNAIEILKDHGVKVIPQTKLNKIKLLRRFLGGFYQQLWRLYRQIVLSKCLLF
jgi:hypothetical protein